MNSEFLKIIANDLENLNKKWTKNPDNDTMRRHTNLLRMWLVEGHLLKAWRAVGFSDQPQVIAPSVEKILDNFPIKKIKFALAGGAKYMGIQALDKRNQFLLN